MAADSTTMAKPVWIQIMITMRNRVFHGGSCSHVCGSPPSPTQAALSTPIWSLPAGVNA